VLVVEQGQQAREAEAAGDGAPVGVYRAPMRSRRDDVDTGAAIERALAHGVVGIGGRLLDSAAGEAGRTAASSSRWSLAHVLAETSAQYDERTARRLERFAAVPTGSLVWTRDGEGLLRLGRITGDWDYDPSPEAASVDLVHVRGCRWAPDPVADAAAPPAVLRTFGRGGRNFQQVHDPDVAAQSLRLWQQQLDG
jgi:hypothetical protein